MTEPICNPHPDAPHGFNRNASHNQHRYVCDCEGWSEPESPDCRTCDYYVRFEGCTRHSNSPVCVKGSKHIEAPRVVLWK